MSRATDEAIAALNKQAHSAAMLLIETPSCLVAPAERIVEQCLRDLQRIPPAERFGADVLMDGISSVYLQSSRNQKEQHRRLRALLKIGAESA